MSNSGLKTLAGRVNEKLKQKLVSFPEYAAEEKAKKQREESEAAAQAQDKR